MVDTLASGASASNGMEVQVLLRAPCLVRQPGLACILVLDLHE